MTLHAHAVLFLFIATGMGIAGAVFDDGRNGVAVYESLYETVLLASFAELALGGFFFALVTYRPNSTGQESL